MIPDMNKMKLSSQSELKNIYGQAWIVQRRIQEGHYRMLEPYHKKKTAPELYVESYEKNKIFEDMEFVTQCLASNKYVDSEKRLLRKLKKEIQKRIQTTERETIENIVPNSILERKRKIFLSHVLLSTRLIVYPNQDAVINLLRHNRWFINDYFDNPFFDLNDSKDLNAFVSTGEFLANNLPDKKYTFKIDKSRQKKLENEFSYLSIDESKRDAYEVATETLSHKRLELEMRVAGMESSLSQTKKENDKWTELANNYEFHEIDNSESGLIIPTIDIYGLLTRWKTELDAVNQQYKTMIEEKESFEVAFFKENELKIRGLLNIENDDDYGKIQFISEEFVINSGITYFNPYYFSKRLNISLQLFDILSISP